MPIQLDAKLNAFRRSSKGFFVTLEIGPDSDWSELASAPLGQAFGVAMVAYDSETGKASPGHPEVVRDDTPNAGQQRGEAGKPRRPFHEMSRAQQAGILCSDLNFQIWFSTKVPGGFTDCADAVRVTCGVASRASLDTVKAAGEKWDSIVASYHQDTGRMAEAR